MVHDLMFSIRSQVPATTRFMTLTARGIKPVPRVAIRTHTLLPWKLPPSGIQ